MAFLWVVDLEKKLVVEMVAEWATKMAALMAFY
jgi:hypothetical protein